MAPQLAMGVKESYEVVFEEPPELTNRVPEHGARYSAAHTKKGRLQRVAHVLLLEHEEAGAIPTSGRFLFYEAEQRGVVSKERAGVRRPDQDFTDAVMWIRDKGIIPWGWIVDETREVTEWEYADSVAAYTRNAAMRARIDCWGGEPPPLILCESRSLAGVLYQVTADYLCPIASTNGQVGGFLVTEIAPMMDEGRRILYFGDYDWQGHQIEANTRRRLEEFVGEIEDWERLALTEEQVEEHDLARLAIPKTDNRYKPPRVHDAIETEALSQTIIARILRDRLDELLPEPLENVLQREHEQRKDYR